MSRMFVSTTIPMTPREGKLFGVAAAGIDLSRAIVEYFGDRTFNGLTSAERDLVEQARVVRVRMNDSGLIRELDAGDK